MTSNSSERLTLAIELDHLPSVCNTQSNSNIYTNFITLCNSRHTLKFGRANLPLSIDLPEEKRMNRAFKKTLIASALVCMGSVATVALSQSPNPRGPQDAFGMPGQHFGPMHSPDPAKVQAMFDKHMSRLKTILQLTPNQESDWAAFNSAMTPPAVRPIPPNPHELEKLTTPERIDRLNAMRAQHAGLVDKHGEATKKFYAALTPSQRKVFDLETLKYLQPRARMRWLHQQMHREGPPK